MFKKAATELLAVRKDDIQSLLRASVQKQNEEIKSALSELPFFEGWSDDAIKQSCILSQIKRFLPGTIIVDSTNEKQHYAYFILDGSCNVIQKVAFNVKPGYKNNPVFTLHRDQNVQKESSGIKFEYFNVQILLTNDCFGLGENLTNRWVTSSTAARCLVMPRDFLFRHNQNNIWTMTSNKLNNSFPDTAEIQHRLWLKVKWYKYKRQLYQQLRGDRKMKISTTAKDVPHYWTINREVPMELVYAETKYKAPTVAKALPKIC